MNWAYLYTFLQTCAIEFPFYWFFLRGRWSNFSCIAAVVAMNALTHPIVFFGFMTFPSTLLKDILCAEVFAFGIEAMACWYFLAALLAPRFGCEHAGQLGFVAAGAASDLCFIFSVKWAA